MRHNQLLIFTFLILALLLSFAIQPLIPFFPSLVPLLLLGVVAVAALVGSVRSTVITIAVSGIAVYYFMSPSHPRFSVSGIGVVRTSLFVMVATGVSLLVYKLRDARARELRSQSIFSDFIHSAPVGFSLHNPDTTFIDINPFLAQWNGLPREAHLGKTPASVVPNIAAAIEPNVRRVAQSGETLTIEGHSDIIDPQRQRYWIASYFPIKNASGTIEAVGTALLDTTKERSAQAALSESEAKYRFLAESMSQYVWTTDEQGKIDYCNRHFLEFTGLTLEQISAGRTLEVIHPDDVAELSRKVEQSLTSGQPFQHEYRARRASDGEYRWHFAHSESFIDARGKKRWLGVGIDITDRKTAQLEVLKAHEQTRMLVASISESFIALDREWRFQFANDRVFQETGKQWSEFQGRNIWEMFPEAANSALKPGYEKVMKERIPHTFEVNSLRPDGSVRYYQVHAYPTPDGLAALVADITQKKEAEGALAESRRMLRLVLDSANIGTWMWNFETAEVMDLGNTAKLFCVEKLESVQDFLEAIDSRDRSMVEGAVAESKRTGHYQCEFRVPNQESTSWLRATGTVVTNDDGKPIYLAGVTIDVSDRHRSDEVRFRLAAIVDSSDDAIISKDLQGVVTSWNAAAERLFGYRAEEMIGRSILTIIPPELQNEEPEILARLRAGQKIDHYETERLHRNGSRVNVALTISPVRDVSGTITGASKIVRDISERKRVQEALIQSEKLAATGRMAAAIAHEVNNPLEAVTNLAYLVSTDESLSEVGRSYARMMIDEIARASEITKQTLAFYRDSGKPSQFDVCDLVDDVIKVNRPAFERRRIEVIRDYRRSEPLNGYASEIRQVLANLFLNAIDAVPDGGRIIARVDVEHPVSNHCSRIRVSVADTGHGIPRETRHRLFEPFVSTKGPRGNGLGLWVSKGIVQKHGGRIFMRSSAESGRSGTVFSVVLPLQNNPVAAKTLG